MKMIDIKGKRILYPLFFIILSGIIIFNVFRIVGNSGEPRVKAVKLEHGWGFSIVKRDKVFINQQFIPLISGKHPFPSRRTAVRTGKLLIKRINEGHIPPISKKDLNRIGIDTLQVQ
jgi:hypothetical protein